MKKLLSLTAAVLILCTSCGRKEEYASYTFYAMNTVIELQANGQDDFYYAQEYVAQCENKFSRTIAASEIYALNHERTAVVSDDTSLLLRRASELSKITGSAFDVCSGALSDLWNITGQDPKLPEPSEIDGAKSKCSVFSLSVTGNTASLSEDGVSVDLGGIAKGYCVQKTLELMKQNGVTDGMASFGGNVSVTGSSKANKEKGVQGWNVGIKNPDDEGGILGYFTLQDKTVAVSGDYERYFELDGKRYHHIFDVKTGYPAKSGLRSAAVICSDGLSADALSTALFVMGLDKASEFYKSSGLDFEALLVTDDARIFITPGIAGKFTPDTSAKTSDGKAYTINTLK